MAAKHVIFVSDTHLSPDAPEAQQNWAAVVRYVTAASPDLVIHLGDLSLDGARNPADLDHARGQLELLPVPWAAVPGNHDIGDNPLPSAGEGIAVTADRRQRWLDVVGTDYWSLGIADWTLLAVNAQLAGSGLTAEASQWSWLEDQLTRADPGQRIALLAHKPLTASEDELAAAPPYRFCPQRRATVSGTCSRGGHRLCSSAGTYTSRACSTSTGPVMSGCPRRGRCYRTPRSRCSAPSAAACCR